jgi:hypothetical protein
MDNKYLKKTCEDYEKDRQLNFCMMVIRGEIKRLPSSVSPPLWVTMGWIAKNNHEVDKA